MRQKLKILQGYLYPQEKYSRKLAMSTIPRHWRNRYRPSCFAYSLLSRDWNIGVYAIVYNNNNSFVDRISEYSHEEILSLYSFIEADNDSHPSHFQTEK